MDGLSILVLEAEVQDPGVAGPLPPEASVPGTCLHVLVPPCVLFF